MNKGLLLLLTCAVGLALVLAGVFGTQSVLASVGPPDISVQANNYISAQPSFGFASAQSIPDISVANGDIGCTFTALAPPGLTDIGSTLATFAFANIAIDRTSTFSVLEPA